MAFHQAEDGSFLAVAALEIERFEIRQDTAISDQSWDRNGGGAISSQHTTIAVDALLSLARTRELAHVIATRAEPGDDGALLRVGWLAFGRGPTAYQAANEAEATWNDVHAVNVAAIEHATLAPVTESGVLVDLLRPMWLPHAQRLSRVPWSPVASVQRANVRMPSPPRSALQLLPRWPARPLSWAPMVAAVAAQQGYAAIALFFETHRLAPPEILRDEEERALRLQRELTRMADSSPDSSVVLSDGGELRTLVRWRLELLGDRATVCRAVLATSEPPSLGLLSVVSSAFVSPSAVATDKTQGFEPRTEWRPLESGVLLVPVNTAVEPDLLLGAEELHRFARTVENPCDEASPLPCARTRHLDLRCSEASGAHLGVSNLRGREFDVRLDEALRFQHVYLIGQTGTGKSTLMLRMIAEDIEQGHGVTVLDPHGSLVEAVLQRIPKERAKDLVFVDPADAKRSVPLNPLFLQEADPVRYAMARDRIVDELLDVFDALYDLRATGGPIFEMYFRAFASMLLGAQKPTDYSPVLPMLEALFHDGDLRKKLIGRMDEVLKATIITAERAGGEANLPNIAPYVTSKTTRFYAPLAARRMLCQRGCLDFNEVLRSKRILLVSMNPSHLGKEAAALIARQIIFRLNQAAMARGASADHPAHFLYVDEFHNFATERFASMLAESRKFRLGLVLAHQYTSQLIRRGDRAVLDAVLGNVGTTVAFRLGAVDAEALARVFAPRATATDIVGLPNHVAIARSGGALGNVPFTLRTLPVPPGRTDLGPKLREHALVKFARKGSLVDAELTESLRQLWEIAG
jgi:hypothetical protein